MGKRATAVESGFFHAGIANPLQRAVERVWRQHRESGSLPARAAATRYIPEPLEARVLLSAAQPAAVSVHWNGSTQQAVAGEYIIDTANLAGFDKLAAKQHFTNITGLGGGGGYLQFDSALSAAQMKRLAGKYPAVMRTVEPNFLQSLASTVPNDTYFADQYGLDNTGQSEPYDYNGDGVIDPTEATHYGVPGDDIDATQAWDITTGSSSVVIADLDTGVDITNPDLAANIYTNPNPLSQAGFYDDVHGWNFVDNSNDVSDTNGHGTNTAGIIAAQGNNTIGVSGVDWNVSLLPVVVADAGDLLQDSDIIAGINYCTMLKSQGVNVVAMNMSFTGVIFPINNVLQNALAAAGKVGILAVAAAGDNSQNIDAAFAAPADSALTQSNVISVAAVDNQGNLALFSDFGASAVEIAAPGVNILSTAPTYIVPENPTFTPVDPSNPTGVPYGYMSGTSQATPFVTGILGLEAAANPSATAAELKAALLSGAKPDAALAAVNGSQPLVATAGVADAYTAVQNVLNYSVGANTARKGNWAGAFGTQGAYVVGDSTAFPSFVTGTFNGGTPVVLQNTTRNAAGLQKPSDLAQHIAAYDAAPGSESVTLDFTDGAVHQVALYVADIDHKRRTETVEVLDPLTGELLSDQTVSKFTAGQYLVYDLRGDVEITITNAGGPSAVFSGIFFDAPTTSPSAFVGTSTSITGANWRNAYGSAGDYIVGDNNTGTLPYDLAGLTTTGTTQLLRANTTAATGLDQNQNIYRTIQADWYSTTSFDVDLTFSDTLLHQVTLYAADYQNKHRSERIEAIDTATGALLASQDLTNFSKGEFVSFDVSGAVTFRVINLGGPNAVLSGLFFDNTPGENMSFQGVNTTSGGNWQQAGYGAVNADIVGETFPDVDTFTLANPIVTEVAGESERVLSGLTSDPRALERVENPSDRIESYIYSNTTITFEVNFGDNTQHQLALYFADYERYHRSEFLTISDAATGDPLIKQRVFNFQNGKYFVYNINAPVIVTITNAAYPNAVLSGLFTD